MSAEREEPGVIVAVCDECGERVILDVEPEASPGEVAEEMEAHGWLIRAPLRQYFRNGEGGYWQHYPQDFCGACCDGEARPKPRFGSGRSAEPTRSFSNDPCDEWPRPLIFVALGLRADCGHPLGDAMCALCLAGHPIGSTGPWWRR